MTPVSYRCAVVGPGRMGAAMASALARAGWQVEGPLGRDSDPRDAEIVLLCVPDSEIGTAASALTARSGMVVGHCSGATTLAPLAPHDAFSVHPLMTVTGADSALDGAACAVAGGSDAALAAAGAIVDAVGLTPFAVEDADRAAYHAGASVASNFLVTLLDLAEGLSGVERKHLAPLVRATVDNWERLGAERALTGPVARGDQATVDRQRAAVVERAPESVDLFDALVAQTQTLAERRKVVAV